jgi:hypothetical protein
MKLSHRAEWRIRRLVPLAAWLLAGAPAIAADCTPLDLPRYDAAGKDGWTHVPLSRLKRDTKYAVAEDYRKAFGAAPGPMLGVAVMTDTDNTNAKAEGHYGSIRLACATPAGK